MKEILVIGAGRSASTLIQYLLNQTSSHDWFVTVADTNVALANEKVRGHKAGKAVAFDLHDQPERESRINNADLVISMLPARMHMEVANTCLSFCKHLLTASYVSPEMQMISEDAKTKGLIFLNECGLDPGIDHMTAQQDIDRIKSEGGRLISLKSFTGGLIAPESDNNPWNYKFTWNPRNVVTAGQGVAKFIRQGRYKYIPYHSLFTRTEPVNIKGWGAFEGYPNRDSLKYREKYGLQDIPTMLRSTLRRPGFCKAWNVFVQLGLTDDSYALEDSENMSYRDYANAFLYYHPTKSVEEKLCEYMSLKRDGGVFKKIQWTGLFERTKIPLPNATPARILQHLLEDKWRLDPEDKDMIVMQHQFEYELKDQGHQLVSSLVTLGSEPPHTAMSKTVGWPLGIAAKLILTDQIKARGVLTPTIQEIYGPILKELKALGVEMLEEHKKL